jgi:ABC-type dipeptide/oligopeptide/nickel transport system permease subunit
MESRVRTTRAPVGYCLTLLILGHLGLGLCLKVVFVYDQVKSTEQAWSIYILQTATLYVTRHDVNITQSPAFFMLLFVLCFSYTGATH